MRLAVPTKAQRALDLLHAAGHEAWLVGGCVRDLLLGRTPGDVDLTTSALPEETLRVFAGLPTFTTGLRHGTVTVLLDGTPIEVTTYRVDGAYTDARHPDGVTFTRSLREDAARRDFTINAMAYDRGAGLRDWFGGREDLAARTIRCIGDPEHRFREDALRILRALRFASVLTFTIDPATAAAARACAPLLAHVSAERIWAELGKLLCGPGAGTVLRAYPDVLGVVLPELLPMVGFDQRNEHHCWDLLTHTAIALDHVPPRPVLRWAALLHDAAKPSCFRLGQDGQGHYHGHAQAGAALADAALRRLRSDRATRERVVTLVRCHDGPLPEDLRLLRRRLARLGPECFFELVRLQQGDALALDPAYCTRVERLERIDRMARDLLSQPVCLTTHDLAVRGEDLLALGYRGPAIGRAQRALLDRVLDGSVPNEREALLQALGETDA